MKRIMNPHRILLAFVSFIFLGPSALKPVDAQAAGAVAMQVERIVKLGITGYNTAMRNGDLAPWTKYFDDKVQRHAPIGDVEGLQAFSDYYAWELANFDATLNTKRMVISGPLGAVQFEWDAVHKATGKPVKLEMAAVFELASSGKFQSVHFYFDTSKYAELFAGAPGAK